VFIPLVDILRCPRPHADTWLVASIERADERFIIEGTLGCPTCLAEYPIRVGVVHFSDRPVAASRAEPSEPDAMRLAAALDLTEPRRTALLHGAWAANAQLVRGVSPSQLLLLNGPEGMSSGDGVSVLVSDVAPFAQASIDAAALDAQANEALFASVRASLRRGGRILAPLATPIPDGFTELARDDEVWVARVDDAAIVSAPIMPTRRSSQSD
jgi:uncharacterized protein YbaR (Trm112 family)